MSYQTDLETIYSNLNTIKTNCNSSLSSKGGSSITNLSGLPAAIASIASLTKRKVTTGTATISSNLQGTLTISHGLGVKPSFFYLYVDSEYTESQYTKLTSGYPAFLCERILKTPAATLTYSAGHVGSVTSYYFSHTGGKSASCSVSTSSFTMSAVSNLSVSNTKTYKWIAIE